MKDITNAQLNSNAPNRASKVCFGLIPRWMIVLTIVILAGFLVWLHFQFHSWVAAKQGAGDFQTLNSLAQSTGSNSVDFYVGEIEDRLFGPLTNTFAFVLFAAACLLYFQNASATVFLFLVFCFLITVKFNVLLFPPYGDAVGGPFVEAVWLARHNFDYGGLFSAPSYDQGGPRVYFFSIYPTYLAILLKIIPWTKAFLVVNHLIVFLMTAAMVTLIRSWLVKSFGQANAMLTAIVVLSIPLVQSQTEAINMELPTLFFAVISVHYLLQKRMGAATLAAVAAILVKGHAITICGLIFLVSFILLFDRTNKKRWTQIGFGLLAVLAALITVGSKFFLKDQHATGGLMGLFVGLPSLRVFYITYVYLWLLGIFAGAIVVDRLFGKEKLSVAHLITEKYYQPLVIFLAAGMWFLLFLNFSAVSPRYRLLTMPFLCLSLVYVIQLIVRHPTVIKCALWTLLILSCSASYGWKHGPAESFDHVILERSLEYRNDLKMYQRLAKVLEEKYSGLTIGSPFIVAQFLAMPEMGYVKEPLNVVAYGMPLQFAGIKNFSGLQNLDVKRTVWIGINKDVKPNWEYPINSRDQVIGEIYAGNKVAKLFVGGISIHRVWMQVQKRFGG